MRLPMRPVYTVTSGAAPREYLLSVCSDLIGIYDVYSVNG